MNSPAKVIQVMATVISIILLISTLIAYKRTHESTIIFIGSLFFLTCITTFALLTKYKGGK